MSQPDDDPIGDVSDWKPLGLGPLVEAMRDGRHFAVERDSHGLIVGLAPVSGRVEFDGERYIVREEPS